MAIAPNLGAGTVDNPHKTSDRCSNGRNDNDSFVHDIYNVGL
jgi:hypothetical protein